ncbi:TetR/AcrR family transcriptional regulator [Geomicrobium sp. JCM 19055]|uniref:TetR/AcrR family transcriptional regulator n=1 Tax=Geomicrobium sp. JCM 19055 TaxID=1460649 RepID=UPI00045ED78B|nr:TetR/AcrR family transcriptional regulator [Geomicrobium sp. JCM 19055]GAJ99509.1 transcriptional regulator, TetR family [Geomicrobium sp. JCM 19055]
MSTKERIVYEAMRAFASKGYEGTTLAEIAANVGIKKPSLYNHFKNKDELYLVVAEKVMNELIEELRKSIETYTHQDLEQHIRQSLEQSCEFIIKKHEGMMYKRFMIFPPVAIHKEVKAIVRDGDERMNAQLVTLYNRGIEENQFHHLSKEQFIASYFCLLDGLFTESFIYEERDFKQRFNHAWDVFWRGVCY